jgi:hypothetical protein
MPKLILFLANLFSILLIHSFVFAQESESIQSPELFSAQEEFSNSVNDNDRYVVVGTAYDQLSGQLVYRESYTALDADKTVRVDYARAEGKIFASKKLTYQGELFQPSFLLEDYRDNEFVSAQFDGPILVLSHEFSNNPKEQKKMVDNATLVVDAGFDAFIQLHWDKLLNDDILKFEFALPNRLSSVNLEIRKISPKESPVFNSREGAKWIYFRLKPATMFISLFADPIYLAYDPQGKYLMRFYGRSNLDNDRGGPWDVRIEYQYFN